VEKHRTSCHITAKWFSEVISDCELSPRWGEEAVAHPSRAQRRAHYAGFCYAASAARLREKAGATVEATKGEGSLHSRHQLRSFDPNLDVLEHHEVTAAACPGESVDQWGTAAAARHVEMQELSLEMSCASD